MSRNFSFKTFFRSVSVDLLHQYFANRQLLADFDWSQESALLADALYSQIESMHDNHEAIAEQDFVMISELANELFVLELHDVARSIYDEDTANPVIDGMMQQSGLLNQVFWISLNHPTVFEMAVQLERAEHMTFKEDCLVGRHLPCATNEEAIEKLKEHVQKFFKRQRRGRNCQIDVYQRHNPTRYCFFAYPEDYPKRDLTYKSSRLVPDVRRPVMEIVFIYEPDSGNLKVHASKMRKVEVMQDAFCKAILGLPGIPDGSTRIYDLSRLLNPGFRFVTDPADAVEEVSLKMLKVAIGKSNPRKLTCEGTPFNGGAELVQRMTLDAIAACSTPADAVQVLSAKIAMKFAAVDGGRKKSVTFTLNVPCRSNLEDKPHHHTARKHIERWKLVRTLLVDTEEAA